MTDPNQSERRDRRPGESDLAGVAAADLARGRDRLRRESEAQADALQQQAATKVDTVSAGLHAAADRVAEDDDLLEREVRRAATSLSGLAAQLQGQSVETTVREVEDFGRRHPALFVGMAVALGVGLGRIARSRTPQERTAHVPVEPHGGAL